MVVVSFTSLASLKTTGDFEALSEQLRRHQTMESQTETMTSTSIPSSVVTACCNCKKKRGANSFKTAHEYVNLEEK